MNDMLSGGPTLSGRSALEQMGDTNDPVEIFDGEDKAVRATIMASAMATDRAADGEAGDTKVNMLPRPAIRHVPVASLGRIGSLVSLPYFLTIIHSTLTNLLVRQASSLTTDDEQNQCWQGRNDLQARRV